MKRAKTQYFHPLLLDSQACGVKIRLVIGVGSMLSVKRESGENNVFNSRTTPVTVINYTFINYATEQFHCSGRR